VAAEIPQSAEALAAAVRAVAGAPAVEPLPLRAGPRERVTLSPEARGQAPAARPEPPLQAYRRAAAPASALAAPAPLPVPPTRARHRQVAIYERAVARAVDQAPVPVEAREAAALRLAA